jgi:hypothetical protein
MEEEERVVQGEALVMMEPLIPGEAEEVVDTHMLPVALEEVE